MEPDRQGPELWTRSFVTSRSCSSQAAPPDTLRHQLTNRRSRPGATWPTPPIPGPAGPVVNGDAWPDLVWRNAATGQHVVWYMNGAAFLGQALLLTVADTTWRVAAVRDFNGDGRPDLLWRSGKTGQVVVWHFNGTTFLEQAVLATVADTNWQIRTANDFNGDGKTDLAWRNVATGQDLVWYFNRATYMGQAMLPAVADPNWIFQ